MKFMRLIVSLVILLFMLSCRSKNDKIFFKGTDKYNQQIKIFTISLQDAQDILISFKEKELGKKVNLLPGKHLMIINKDYVFTFPYPNKMVIGLSGYYINGFSGKLIYKKSTNNISWKKYNKIKGKTNQSSPVVSNHSIKNNK